MPWLNFAQIVTFCLGAWHLSACALLHERSGDDGDHDAGSADAGPSSRDASELETDGSAPPHDAGGAGADLCHASSARTVTFEMLGPTGPHGCAAYLATQTAFALLAVPTLDESSDTLSVNFQVLHDGTDDDLPIDCTMRVRGTGMSHADNIIEFTWANVYASFQDDVFSIWTNETPDSPALGRVIFSAGNAFALPQGVPANWLAWSFVGPGSNACEAELESGVGYRDLALTVYGARVANVANGETVYVSDGAANLGFAIRNVGSAICLRGACLTQDVEWPISFALWRTEIEIASDDTRDTQ